MDLRNILNPAQEENTQQYSKEEYAAMKKAEREEFWARVDAKAEAVFSDPAALQDFLDFAARCSPQRTANLLLLHEQNPEITDARTFDDWKRAGRSIQSGAEGYTAMIPQSYEREDGSKASGYNIGKLFDVSQTRGRPLPEPQRYETEELITAAVMASPVPVLISGDLPPQVQAQYVPQQHTIFVRNGMSAGITFCALARERAQANFDVDRSYRRQAFAAQSYCAAYMTARHYDLDTSGFRFDRVASVCTGLDAQGKRNFLSDAKQAAYHTINSMEQQLVSMQPQIDEYDIAEPQPKSNAKPVKSETERE